MKFIVPSDFCDLPSDTKNAVLNSAEKALFDKKSVFFDKKHFTNFDELKSFLTDRCKEVQSSHDWPGEVLDANG